MIHSGFRPSDDACTYPLFVPANLFAIKALRELAEIANGARRDSGLANDATALAAEVEAAVNQYATMTLPDGGDVWAYEMTDSATSSSWTTRTYRHCQGSRS